MIMTQPFRQIDTVRAELERIKGNCLYTAQGYFEAAKNAELWGRLMVFVPACITAIAGLLDAIGIKGPFSAVAAVAGSVAATASFLGSQKNAADYLASARAYTALKHRVESELSLLAPDADPADLSARARELNADYIRITANDIPLPNRFFDQASKRIEQGAAE
ncbi:hypothetical protein ABZ478_19280 [Streptomyces sp. NPDC005706]|uniref:hypothetical protein n=1 Tax=Streptomyces sp. NPDC005706 TaxID=3157169 RepID=UPI0034066803